MPEPEGGAGLATGVANVLDKSGVPNLLFGWLAIALLAKDEGLKDIDFVVNDHQVEVARDVLVRAGFKACTLETCPEMHENRAHHLAEPGGFIAQHGLTPEAKAEWLATNSVHAIAAVHFHLDSQAQHFAILSLFPKSQLLWWLPDLELRDPAPDDRNLTLTTNCQLPPTSECSGPWIGFYPVKILTPIALVEGLLTLTCRDVGHPRDLANVWAEMAQTFMELDAYITAGVAQEFKDLWNHLMARRPPGSTVAKAYDRLIATLLPAGRLPNHIPRRSSPP
ncbi:hypothetical protein BJX70DRAFT_399853 [Aspergillus crustosus]